MVTINEYQRNRKPYIREDGEIGLEPIVPLCDFCLAVDPDPIWSWPVGFVAIDPSLNGITASDDPWAACDTCNGFIMRDDWNGLLDYSFDQQLAGFFGTSAWRTTVPNASLLCMEGRRALVEQYARLRAALLVGPPQRESKN